MFRICSILAGLFFAATCFAQSETDDFLPKYDYQIYLTKPAKEIREIQYEKDCSPVKGSLSEDRKAIIMKDYQRGKRVYVQVVYFDGTTEEFVRSSCFIDPVII